MAKQSIDIQKDIKNSQNKERKNVSLSMSDDKYLGNFNIEKEDAKKGWQYNHYEKVFDNLKDFSDYVEAFFKN